jgi:uncharacterized protein YndB with AHSA1/START domain
MAVNLVAKASTLIRADKSQVWEALVSPDAIKTYMFGADVESDWREGSPITWKGEMNGKPFEDKGKILIIEPEQLLKYSHFSPSSGKPDKPENYHTVTITLTGEDGATDVSLSQDNNPHDEAVKHSEKNWHAMLESLKKYVEQTSTVAASGS